MTLSKFQWLAVRILSFFIGNWKGYYNTNYTSQSSTSMQNFFFLLHQIKTVKITVKQLQFLFLYSLSLFYFFFFHSLDILCCPLVSEWWFLLLLTFSLSTFIWFYHPLHLPERSIFSALGVMRAIFLSQWLLTHVLTVACWSHCCKINKKLISLLPESKTYAFGCIVQQ